MYPKLYVEGVECLENKRVTRECVAINGNVEVWLKPGQELPPFLSGDTKFLGKEVYDRFPQYVADSGRVIRDMVLLLPDGRTRIYLKRGDELMLLPVEGFTKTLIADVGNRVRTGDAFAAVTTRKGEVHYLKPPRSGTVVFIDEIRGRPHYVYYILPED